MSGGPEWCKKHETKKMTVTKKKQRNKRIDEIKKEFIVRFSSIFDNLKEVMDDYS